MVRLTILGDVDLRAGDGTVVGSILSQPRRFALLVYLALEAKGGGVQRDRLLGVFWPDLPQENARQALRTALHFLRRSLGKDAIAGHGDLLALDAEHVTCDAAELCDALDRGDTREALRLYSGDLLPGFYVDGGPAEFEHWLEEARTRLRRQVAGAAWSLAETQERAGNQAGAGAWARRAAELSEADEAAVRRAIILLGRIGDRAGALALHDALVRRLREEFDATPSPETEAAVAAVRARASTTGEPEEPEVAPPPVASPGDPAAARPDGAPATEATAVSIAGAATEAAAGSSPGSRSSSQRRRPLQALLSGAVSVVLAVAFYSLWGLERVDEAWSMPGAPLEPVLQVEAVRDFSADGGAADMAGALTLELAARLSETDGLRVVPVTTADSAEGERGRNPGFVVRSGLLQSDSVVRVTVMILDAASGATLERIVAEQPFTGAASTLDGLVEELGMRVRREVGRAVDDFQRQASARNGRAVALVRTGLHELEAADSLRRTGATDAAAHLFASADSQLALAQAEAPRWPEPSIQRAEVALRSMWLHLLPPQRDTLAVARSLRAGMRAADAALAIAPDDPAALEARGTLSYWTWLTRSAGADADNAAAAVAAERDLRRATELDPGRGGAWAVLSALHEIRGDFAQANLAARRARRADPYLQDSQEILVRLFATSLEIGDTTSARTWCEEIGRRLQDSWMPGYCRLEQLAWRGLEGVTPDSVLRLVEATTPDGPAAGPVGPRLEMLAAAAFARSGLRADADRMLERARARSGGDSELLKLEAWARLLLGQEEAALGLLHEYRALNARAGRSALRSRRFEPLRETFQIWTGAPLEPLDRG